MRNAIHLNPVPSDQGMPERHQKNYRSLCRSIQCYRKDKPMMRTTLFKVWLQTWRKLLVTENQWQSNVTLIVFSVCSSTMPFYKIHPIRTYLSQLGDEVHANSRLHLAKGYSTELKSLIWSSWQWLFSDSLVLSTYTLALHHGGPVGASAFQLDTRHTI